MDKHKNIFYFLTSGVILFLIFRNWFIFQPLSSGDWSYLYQENILEFEIFQSPPLWVEPYYRTTAKLAVQVLNLSWELAEKIFWFWPFLGLSIFSSYYLTKSWIGVLIYVTNTYALMLVGGGQMGVALAYSVAPLVLGRFIKLVDLFSFSTVDKLKVKSEKLKVTIKNLKLLKKSIIAGLVFSLQVMWDPRIAYITMMGVGVHFLFKLKVKSEKLKVTLNQSKLGSGQAVKSLKLFLTSLFFVFGVPLLIVAGLHMYWILPMMFEGFENLGNLGEAYTSKGAVEFLSFATFSNAISLLHPNWPENIFGKVYFMRGEFLLLPILAFSSLLFLKFRNPQEIQNKNNIVISQYRNIAISFFAFLALLGAFLAKGANPPFGEVYLWLFEHFPGFIMFRDPTKFYLLTVLSYTVLIPFTLKKVSYHARNYLPYYRVWEKRNIVVVLFMVYWLFLIRPAWMGELSGTFKTREVPAEYVRLKDFLHNQPKFFRTFWLPKRQRFGFFSNNHPAIDSLDLLKVGSASAVVSWLKGEEAKEQLSRWAVKYVIVPYDSEGELFLEDRKYSEEEYQKVVKEVGKIEWLREIDCSIVPLYHSIQDFALFDCSGGTPFGKITVFEVVEYKNRFWREENLKSQN